MSLTLGNDLTGTVAREVDAANRRAGGLGESLTTGTDKFVEVVDGFLGSSLRDGEVVLGAIAKNTAYSINMLAITDEYLKAVGSSLQAGLKTIAQAGPLSADKLAVLQRNLDDKKIQVALLIKTADFDGKAVLGGGASKVEVQVGLSITDKLTLAVKDISAGKLFRSSVSSALNEWLKADISRNTHYQAGGAATAAEITVFNTAIENNDNIATIGQAGNTTDVQIAAGLIAVIAANPTLGTMLDIAAPLGLAVIAGNAANTSFVTADAADLAALFGDGPAALELTATIMDNAATNIATPGDNAARVLAQDVFTNALNTIRSEQAAISNQKSNVIEAADALRATTNVTQKAADSYLKTDYVMTAQQYSETIRTMVASITSLQAANKIPEAAQRLVDALAR